MKTAWRPEARTSCLSSSRAASSRRGRHFNYNMTDVAADRDTVAGPPPDMDTTTWTPLRLSDVQFVQYTDEESQIATITSLIDSELSEPYSIFTYRYFINSWPNLCFLAHVGEKCIGVVICKVRCVYLSPFAAAGVTVILHRDSRALLLFPPPCPLLLVLVLPPPSSHFLPRPRPPSSPLPPPSSSLLPPPTPLRGISFHSKTDVALLLLHVH